LTSIDINVLSLGKIATERLMAQLNHEDSNGMQLVVPHKLIKRETVLNLHHVDQVWPFTFLQKNSYQISIWWLFFYSLLLIVFAF